MSSPSDNSLKSPLDAALKIVSELQGMTPENQFLAIKFVTETLKLKLPAPFTPAVTLPVHAQQAMQQPHAASGLEHSTDIRSFTVMKAPKSDQQFAAVVAYFYQFEAKPGDRKDDIDADVMKEAARLAGRPQVERWNQTLTNAKNAGYLDASGSGKFKLSSVGENLVAITLPNNDRPGNKVAKKLKTKKRTVTKKR